MTDEITPYLVLNAYAVGFFPMAETREQKDIFWVDPDQRGIIPLGEAHIPTSLRRVIRKKPFTITCNTDFESVVHGCAAPTDARRDTWINETIIGLFCELHRMGYAHSIECWQEKKLVGGLYGVALGGAFFAESMFSRVTQASKLALVNLIARLKYSGFTLLDTQFITEHLKMFGGHEISREEYKRRLARAIQKPCTFFSDPDPDGWLMDSILKGKE